MKRRLTRFFLFDNGGRTADRYSLIDMRPEVFLGERYYNYFHFNSNPYHPQGIGMVSEVPHRDHELLRRSKPNPLGSLITAADLPPQLWSDLEKDLRLRWGATDEDIDRLYRGA